MTNETFADFETKRWIWGTDITQPRMLHLALRVTDLDRAARFYVDGLGMKILDRIRIGPRKVNIVFVGYGDYGVGGLIELAYYEDDTAPRTHGTGYDHMSVGVSDVIAMVAKLEGMGAEVKVRPTEYLGKGPRIAYVKDPDGNAVELIQTVRD
jgi:lactoylglutathione lyase